MTNKLTVLFSGPRRRLGAALFGGGLIACIMHAACGDPSHLFVGRYYLEGRDCLGTDSVIDVVEGDDPGVCPVVCLIDPANPNAQRAVYVSTMCAPYPYAVVASTTDPSCIRALAAFERNDTCNQDGTSSNPREAGAPPGEAGAEDAGEDADAGADVGDAGELDAGDDARADAEAGTDDAGDDAGPF